MDWKALLHDVDEQGYAVTPTPLIPAQEGGALARGFDDGSLFRSTVDMARYRYGEGSYRYYRDPLPETIAALRAELYPHLAPLANRWQQELGLPDRFPATLDELAAQCAEVGQTKPTPLILRYEPGGWNAMHQDLYGEIAFPLQVTVALTRPGEDFTGGENLLVEQRPRAQSRGTAVTLPRGHGLIFPTRYRPVEGSRGHYRVNVRHGVSTVHTGTRLTLGIIFHNAK